MELTLLFVLGAVFSALKFIGTSSDNNGNNKIKYSSNSIHSMKRVLGVPDESLGYKDRYHFPDGEIVVFYYPDHG